VGGGENRAESRDESRIVILVFKPTPDFAKAVARANTSFPSPKRSPDSTR
jgi:hypothetical protein